MATDYQRYLIIAIAELHNFEKPLHLVCLKKRILQCYSLKSGDLFIFVMGKHLFCHRILQNKTIVEIKCLEICKIGLDTIRKKKKKNPNLKNLNWQVTWSPSFILHKVIFSTQYIVNLVHLFKHLKNCSNEGVIQISCNFCKLKKTNHKYFGV